MPRSLAALVAAVCLTAARDAADAPLHKVTNLDKVNSPGDEDDPHVSADGLRLYYAAGAGGAFNLRVAERKNRAQAWPRGEPLEGLFQEQPTRAPCLTQNGHELFYSVLFPPDPTDPKARQVKTFDVAQSINLGKAADFTGPTAVLSVCTAADELHPWVTANGQELYFSRKTPEGWRVLRASRPGKTGAFAAPQLVEELPAEFHHATVSTDGKTLYLQGPVGGNRWGLFRSVRSGTKEKWGEPEPLEGLNHPRAPTGDRSPCLSRDGTKLYFASDRPGGKGGLDLWVVETSLQRKGP